MNDYSLESNQAEDERLQNQGTILYDGPYFLDRFFQQYKLSRVLDVGCGTGVVSRYIAQRYPNINVIGIDKDSERIARNKKSLETFPLPNLEFRTEDLFQTSFSKETFDLTFCRFVLMHLNKPSLAIDEMKRVTKVGGLVIAHEGIHDAIWIEPPRKKFQSILMRWIKFMNEKFQDPSIGLKLNTLFNNSHFKNIEISILSHVAKGNDPLFSSYIKNWSDHMPSLQNSLSGLITESEFIESQEELKHVSDSDFYLELTAVACGKK